MLDLSDEIVDEFLSDKPGINKATAKRALARALNTLPDHKQDDKETIFRFSKGFIKPVKVVKKMSEVQSPKPERRGRKKSLNGKKILGGTKKYPRSFWDFEDAIEKAIDDEFLPDAVSGGNYQKVKEFLRNDWAKVDVFKLPDLQKALEEKYPEESSHSGFSMQRWGDAFFC